jgi:hypothetical protein
MTEIRNEDGILHIYLKETLRVKEAKKQKGRPREEIPDRNAVSQKTMEDLTSDEYMRNWDALFIVLQVCGSYRKAEKWLRKYCPTNPTGRKLMADILKSHEKMKIDAMERVKELLENARKNPYLTQEDLELAIEVAIREFTRQKIAQASTKYPVGTEATDQRELNLREWHLKKYGK